MLTLAVEASTMHPSLALFREGEVLAERAWTEVGRGGRMLFAELQALTRESGVGLAEVDQFVCGRGPGIFSSLRMALTAVRAAALPSRAPVYALSSGEALAWEWIMHRDALRVGVVGDARRGVCWLGIFERGDALPRCVRTWALVRPDELVDLAGSGTVWLSPDAERLEALPKEGNDSPSPLPDLLLAYPRARHLGACALCRIEHGHESEAPEPLYMHPPVDPPKVIASD